MYVRKSIQELWYYWSETEDRDPLNKVIRAFRGIQKLPPTDPNSFELIAGYHGLPFRGEGQTSKAVWGGFCTHATVLFPTWHRAYLLRLERALRTIEGCEDVAIPYWDETFVRPKDGLDDLIPEVLVMPEWDLDGDKTNPLYSYSLQRAMKYDVEGGNGRYTKDVGYTTVRYPLSGLVGTEQDRKATKEHNAQFAGTKTRIDTLRQNIANWCKGKVDLDEKDTTPLADTISTQWRFKRCLFAPNYTFFSNTESSKQQYRDDKELIVSMESAHNGVHLAVGGFYQSGSYNASPIKEANGDMGTNEMASFDPIFWLHHSYCDYVFWNWQKMHRKTRPGSLEVIEGFPGTTLPEGTVTPDDKTIPKDTALDMEYPLYPFRKTTDPKDTQAAYYTSHDLTHIEDQLGYTYGPGSLDSISYRETIEPEVHTYKRVHNINRADYNGSFVVRTYAVGKNNKRAEVGREPVLSRWNLQGCQNCRANLQVESDIVIEKHIMDYLTEGSTSNTGDAGLTYEIEIQTQAAGTIRSWSSCDSKRVPKVDNYPDD